MTEESSDDKILTKKYEFKTTPNPHQLAILKKSWSDKYYGLFWQMRTRKTKVMIDNAGILFERDKINMCIAIPKKGSYHNWEKQVSLHLPDRIATKVFRWINGKWNLMHENKVKDSKILYFYIINVEAFSTGSLLATFKSILKNNKVFLVVDESTSIKNKSARTVNVKDLGYYATYKRILTGTPIPRSPLDIFEQCEFLKKGALGFSSYYAFKAKYVITKRIYISQRDKRTGTKKRRGIDVVSGYHNLDDLYKRLAPFSSRLLRKDCGDTSEKDYQTRLVELTPEQRKAYIEIAEQGLHICEEGTASVLHQLTLRMRLHEICCGQLTLDDRKTIYFPTNKKKELDDIIEECGGKMIIWAHYTANIRDLEDHLKNKYGKDSVVSFYGATSAEARVEAERSFQAGDSPVRFFLSNQSTGGYGLTLTAAELIVYYSNTHNLEHRDQSEERADGLDKNNNIPVIDLVCRDTEDQRIADNLRNKNITSGLLFKESPKKWFKIPKK